MKKVFLSCLLLSISMMGIAFEQKQSNDIVLVSSNALTGPAAALGTKLSQGAKMYFHKINKRGGIAGRQIKLETLDDGYEPFRTLENTYQVLTRANVLALFNYAGTPNAHAILPFINEHKIPFLTPFTGAEFLRNPVNANIFNLRASYNQEAKAQIDYLVSNVKAKNIALLVQADQFGLSVESSYLSAMEKYKLKPVVTTRFRRNTQDIELALAIMLKHNIDAVAFVGTYRPLLKFINKAHEKNFSPFYTSVSFASSRDLFANIKKPTNILITEVVPKLATCQLAVCQEFLKDIKQNHRIEPEPIVFEGYLNAKLFVEAAKLCGSSLSRHCLIAKLAHFQSDFGGLQVTFSDNNHQGLNNVYFSLFDSKSKVVD